MGTIPDVDGGQGPDAEELAGVEPEGLAVPVRVVGNVTVDELPARSSTSWTRDVDTTDGAQRVLKRDLTRARAVISWDTTSDVYLGSKAAVEAGHGKLRAGGTYECFSRDELYIRVEDAKTWVTVIAENWTY